MGKIYRVLGFLLWLLASQHASSDLWYLMRIIDEALEQGRTFAIVLVNFKHPSSTNIYPRKDFSDERLKVIENTARLLHKYKNNDNVFFFTIETDSFLKPHPGSKMVDNMISAKRDNYYERMVEFEVTPSMGFDELEYENVMSYEDWLDQDLNTFMDKQNITHVVPAGSNVDNAIVDLTRTTVVRSVDRKLVIDRSLMGLYEPHTETSAATYKYPSYAQRAKNIDYKLDRIEKMFPGRVINTTRYTRPCR